MEYVDLVIAPKYLLPIAPKNRALENHALVIHNRLIKAVLPTAEASARYTPKEYLELKNHVVMPGLINAHAHTPMNLFRGLADDLSLMDWLQHHIWPAESALINTQSVALGCQLAIAEMIRSGITCFNDHYFFHDTLASVAAEAGMRACIGLLVINVPTQWARTETECLQKAKETLLHTPSHPLISWALAPHAPYTVTSAALTQIKTLSDEYGLPIHMHVHETAYEVNQSLKEHGTYPLIRLDQLGLLSPRFIAVHMTQLTDVDIARLKATGTHVVHCPESNLKLSSGFAPIEKLREAKVNVAIGTDGAASNNDLDLFGEMRTAALLAKGIGKPTDLPAEHVLEMATINGAKALGLDHKIGSLEPGKEADCIAIDLDTYFSHPVYNPFSHLVYAINRLQVSDVWIAGTRVLQDSQLTTLNTDRLIKDLLSWKMKADHFRKAEFVCPSPAK